MGLESINQQQMAVASNLSAAQGLDQVLRSELERQLDTENSTKIEENALKKALDGKKANLGTEIIAKLAVKLAQTMPTSKLLGNLKEEYEHILNPREEAAQDLIDIQNPISRLSKPQKYNQNQQGGSHLSDEEAAAQKPASDIKEYIGAYSQMLVNGGSEVKKKLEQMEKNLLEEKGVSLKDLQSVKTQVANTIRSEILQQIKRAFLKQALTKGKSLEWLIAKKEVGNFIDYAFLNKRLGGYNFGGLHGHLQSAVDKVRDETAQELRDFLDDALTQEVTKKAMGKEGKDAEKEIENLLKLGQKIGFNVENFVKKIPKLKDDLGLNPVIDFEYAPGTDMNNGQSERHKYQYTPQEEKEILTDKLRALYLRRALYGDLRTVLETQFKMIKLKNGLIRLGVKNFNEVESEGKVLAKVKLFQMLREAFEERATYAKLSGEAWKMTERKIKTVLKNLEKLGVNLSQTELDLMRDKANEKMYREAEHELSLINAAIEARGEIAYLTSKKKMAGQILERLAEESGFKAPGHELELSIEEAC